MEGCNTQLYRKVARKGFRPSHVCEVGVWHPHTSNVYQFIRDGIRTTLIEPDPESAARIRDAFKDQAKVDVHEVAITDSAGHIELCSRASSTYVMGLPESPALVNDSVQENDQHTFFAQSLTFDAIDDGTVDLLSVDTEGSEWFVLKNMKSRPTVISVETHGGRYRNPFTREITEWMHNNGYVLWYVNKSDSVYLLRGAIAITIADRCLLALTRAATFAASRKKRMSQRLKRAFASTR